MHRVAQPTLGGFDLVTDDPLNVGEDHLAMELREGRKGDRLFRHDEILPRLVTGEVRPLPMPESSVAKSRAGAAPVAAPLEGKRYPVNGEPACSRELQFNLGTHP